MQTSGEETLASQAPLFTIITVVRNNLDGLKLTKSTLDKQTCKDWEWLVIDGDSTDGTKEFALSCCGTRVRAVSEKDRGIFDAMNKGLKLATGQYVIFMNSGDLLATESSLAEVKVVCLAEKPDVLFCSSVMDFGIIRIPRPVKSPSYIWHGQPGLHQATIFNRSEHVKYLYDLGYPICADYDVITRMSAAGLKMRSAPILVSENEFNADANSGRKKVALILEAVRAQRRNLRLGYPQIAVSVLRRCASEVAAKTLTWVDSLKGRVSHRNS
jgi:putative colanic acid biosynthesis glycosyltransferase